MVCLGLAGAERVVSAAPAAEFDSVRIFAHLAFCACAILRRDAADITRVCKSVRLRTTGKVKSECLFFGRLRKWRSPFETHPFGRVYPVEGA
jgi:hypothetical protein